MRTIRRITQDEWDEKRDVSGDALLIVGGAKKWPAIMSWHPNGLRSAAGERFVNVFVSQSGYYTPDSSLTTASALYNLPNVPLKLATMWVLGSTPAGPKYYVSQMGDISQWLPELAGDVRFPRWSTPSRVNFWFGSAGTITPLHFDREHNLFAQIYGSKEFTIFNPADTPYLYQYAAESKLPQLSHVRPEDPDLDRYPLFAKAQPMKFTMNPGDLLFLPRFWWHRVRSLSVSVSVNQWWLVPLEDYWTCPNAFPLLAEEHRGDRWSGLRKAERLTRAKLLTMADEVASASPSVAVLAADVVIDDWEKWMRATYTTFLSSPLAEVRRAVEPLLIPALEHRDSELVPSEVRRILHRVRNVLGDDIESWNPPPAAQTTGLAGHDNYQQPL